MQFDSQINSSFNEQEQKELAKIITKFDDLLPAKGESFESREMALFEMISKAKTGEEIINISDSLFGSCNLEDLVSKSTLNKIWVYDGSVNGIKQLSLNYNGSYKDFLEALANTKGELLKDYFENFEIAGDLSPAMVATIQKKYDHLNMKDDNIRLVIAIHYLTLSKQNILTRK